MDLITQILRGMRDTADAEALPEDYDSIPQLQQTCPSVSLVHDVAPGLRATIASGDKESCNKHRFTVVKLQNGDAHRIQMHKHFRDAYTNESTQEHLPRAWVEEAIHEDLEYFNSRVWTAMRMEEAMKQPGAKIAGSRRVSTNKNDVNGDVRARVVAQEVPQHADHSFFASTPSRVQRSALQRMGNNAHAQKPSPKAQLY